MESSCGFLEDPNWHQILQYLYLLKGSLTRGLKYLQAMWNESFHYGSNSAEELQTRLLSSFIK